MAHGHDQHVDRPGVIVVHPPSNSSEEALRPLLTLLNETVKLYVRPSVCLSVCPIIRPPHAAAAGLLLWAGGHEISIDKIGAPGRRPSSKCQLM